MFCTGMYAESEHEGEDCMGEMQALTVDLKPGQREVQQTLDVPVVATALMVRPQASVQIGCTHQALAHCYQCW